MLFPSPSLQSPPQPSPQCLSPCQELLDIHPLTPFFCASLKSINMSLLSRVSEKSLGTCVGVRIHMHIERSRRGILIEDTEKATWKWEKTKTFSSIACWPTGLLNDQSISYAVCFCFPHSHCALTTSPCDSSIQKRKKKKKKSDESKTYKEAWVKGTLKSHCSSPS